MGGGKKDKKGAKKSFVQTKSETPQPKKSGKPEMFKSTPKSEPTKKKNFKPKPIEDDSSDLSTEDFEALLNGPGSKPTTPKAAVKPLSASKKNSQEKKSKKSSPPKLVPISPGASIPEINAKKIKLVKDSGVKVANTNNKENTSAKANHKALKRKLVVDNDEETEKVPETKSNENLKEETGNKKRKIETSVEDEETTKTAATAKLTATDIAKELKIKAEAEKRTLFIKNLSRGVTDEQIRALSKDILEVRIRIIFQKKFDNKKSYAYLIFKDEKTAEANFKSLTGKKIGKDEIIVDYVGAKSKTNQKNKTQVLSVEELDTKRLYVNGFPRTTTSEEILGKLFPTAKEITLPRRSGDSQPIGYAFVKYEDDATCKAAHDQMQGKTLEGRNLTVLFAKLSSNRPEKSDLLKSTKSAKKSKPEAKAVQVTKKTKKDEDDEEDEDDDDEMDDEDEDEDDDDDGSDDDDDDDDDSD